MRTIPVPAEGLNASPASGTPQTVLHRQRAHLATWLWTGAALTFVILVIGGITRLTQSGLSIVDWQPISGIVPPIGDAQWLEAFDRYRQSPEYLQLRRGMTLDEFRFIFFWEYLHRVAARLIGLVFVVPFVVFWLRGYFGEETMRARRALLLFGLGAMQGVVGWLMVYSGLVDQPHVSHYRLAIHLGIAFAIFGCCVWFALDVRRSGEDRPMSSEMHGVLRRWLPVLGGLLAVQIFWGALVAGLKAGLYFNTFPLMGGSLIPPFAWGLDPWILNLVENPITVQWVHRILGTLLGLVAIALYFRVRAVRTLDPRSRLLNHVMLALVLSQYLLGVLTLLYHVPVSLGVAHQAMAMILFGVWLVWMHGTGGRRERERVSGVGHPVSG